MTTPVTVVVQTRVREGQEDAFSRWQVRISAAAAAHPGFIEQSVLPPNPPAQIDWAILQRFADTDAATAWLRSDRRQLLLAEAQPLLVGVDDVHLVHDTDKGVLPAPVSAVIATRVRPGQEAAYRRWEQRIAAAQTRAPGFQGYRFQPPVPGVQEDWVAILRFASEATLQAWLDSPVRHALLREADSFTEAFHVRIVRTGFEQWFATDADRRPPPPWKQNMIVLLLLYPVVFLFGLYVQTPWLMGRAGLPFWAALFLANAVSILLLNVLVPRVCRLLDWWLNPLAPRGSIDWAGAGLVVALYAAWLYLFARLS